MDPQQGADLWNQYIAPLAQKGYTILGSPSTTSAPDGLDWIQAWLPLISVQPTHICVHYYDISADGFKSYMNKFYAGAGYKPLMVTEYACQNFNDRSQQCSDDQIWSFINDTAAWMDLTNWITAYAPFGPFNLSPQPPSSTHIYISAVPRLHARHGRRQPGEFSHGRRRPPDEEWQFLPP
jgi:hypothetical protein